MALAVRIHETGGPEVLRIEDINVPQPGVNEVLIRQRAIGVNYIDVYHRTGLYKLLGYPIGLGIEAAGVVEEVGKSVTQFHVGDRVAYCGGPVGAYAEYRTIPARHVIKLPEGISNEVAAAAMLKGLTAHYLLCLTFQVHPGDTVLIHAAAGGVGLIACQLAKHLGARVIGTVGTPEKAALARENGCDLPIIYTQEDMVDKVKEYTEGRGVDAVYDSVGKTTFMPSLDCLKKFGMMVSFGQSSGAIPPIDPQLLSQKGSLYLTRPTLMHHIEDYDTYAANAAKLFNLIAQKIITVRIGGLYHLGEAKQAHMDLEARKTAGALLLQA
jgi:NADPH:quinone reductase